VQQTDLADAGGQGINIAEIMAMTLADADVGNDHQPRKPGCSKYVSVARLAAKQRAFRLARRSCPRLRALRGWLLLATAMRSDQRRGIAEQILLYVPIDLRPRRDWLLAEILPADSNPIRSLMRQRLNGPLDAASVHVTDDNLSIHEVRPRRAGRWIDVPNIDDPRCDFSWVSDDMFQPLKLVRCPSYPLERGMIANRYSGGRRNILD
jgi:hypothetical protein